MKNHNTVSLIKSIRLRWARHVAKIEDGIDFKILKCKHIGKRPLGRSKRRWQDNIRIGFQEIDARMENWIGSAKDRDYRRSLVNETMKLTNSMAYGIRRFNAGFTRAFQ